MTARERIIETMTLRLTGRHRNGSSTYVGGVDDALRDTAALLDGIPPVLLWEWLIETGKIEQVGFYLDEYGFEGMKHGLEGPENSGVPVFRLVAEGNDAILTPINDAILTPENNAVPDV